MKRNYPLWARIGDLVWQTALILIAIDVAIWIIDGVFWLVGPVTCTDCGLDDETVTMDWTKCPICEPDPKCPACQEIHQAAVVFDVMFDSQREES